MQQAKERRKIVFIKKEFQRNFIIKFCALIALGALLSGLIVYAMSSNTLTTTFENSRLTIKSTSDYIMPSVLMASAIVIIVIGIAAISVTLVTSHKIAGPLYRMEKDIDRIAGGDLRTNFHLRVGDELKALATGLDAMSTHLRGRVGTLKGSIERADELMRVLGKEPKEKELAELRRVVNDLHKAMEQFKI